MARPRILYNSKNNITWKLPDYNDKDNPTYDNIREIILDGITVINSERNGVPNSYRPLLIRFTDNEALTNEQIFDEIWNKDNLNTHDLKVFALRKFDINNNTATEE